MRISLILIMLFIIIFSFAQAQDMSQSQSQSQSAFISGGPVRSEVINGRHYKVIYHLTEDGITIYYFDHGGIPQGKWRLGGVEVFRDGELIEDSFSPNDR